MLVINMDHTIQFFRKAIHFSHKKLIRLLIFFVAVSNETEILRISIQSCSIPAE